VDGRPDPRTSLTRLLEYASSVTRCPFPAIGWVSTMPGATQPAPDESKFVRINEMTLSPQDIDGFADAWRRGNPTTPPDAPLQLLAARKDIRGRLCSPLPPAIDKNFGARQPGSQASNSP